MVKDKRHKNGKWVIVDLGDGTVSPSDASLAVLMDLRDELQELNRHARDHSVDLKKILAKIPKRRRRKPAPVIEVHE